VIVGSGAFVEIADDYDGFVRAFLRKPRRELSLTVSRDQGAPWTARHAAIASARNAAYQ